MPDKNTDNKVNKVLYVLENLLFLGKAKMEGKDNSKHSKAPDDIKNRILLKIERAEIMAAMVAMREGKGE